MTDDFPVPAPMRPIWLVTLADLALLLLGFLVLVQATGRADRKALVAGLHDRFGVTGVVPASTPMPVAAFATTDFATGSAALPDDPASLIAWARQALADPRVALNVSGTSDGTAADVDPATQSGAVLAADRARAVVAALAAAHVATGRIALATTQRPGLRRAIVTLAFAGEPSRSVP